MWNSFLWWKHEKIGKFQEWLFSAPKPNILRGTTRPTKFNGYKARDGYFYNGYMMSTDCAEDFFVTTDETTK